MVDEEKIQAVQEMLAVEYARFAQKSKTRKPRGPSYNDFARHLGVSASSLNQWIQGTRLPDLSNALILAPKLGNRLFVILGYPHIAQINDDRLKYIVDNWERLGDDTIAELTAIARGEERVA